MNWIMSKLYTYSKVLVAGLLLIGCQSNRSEKTSRVENLPFYKEATFTPNWLDPNEVPANFHQIPSFSLINQNGDEVTETHLDGKLTVVDFFFTTCPGICPKMTDNMSIVQEAFLDEELVQIFSHSVTPEYDSAEVLLAYADQKGIVNGKWQLLTGKRSTIYDLGRNQYFVEEDLGLEKDPDDFIHTENFILIDSNRRIRGIYNGLNKSSIQQLIADVKTLKKETI